MLYNIFVLIGLISTAFASIGVDVVEKIPAASWQCMKADGYNFATVRIYYYDTNFIEPVAAVDSNGPFNVQGAWTAGIANVDAYIIPCYNCGNPAKQVKINSVLIYDPQIMRILQVDDSINYLLANGIPVAGVNSTTESTQKVNRIWIYITNVDYYTGSHTANTNFITDMAKQIIARGSTVGIYTSRANWLTVTGSTSTLSAYPLW